MKTQKSHKLKRNTWILFCASLVIGFLMFACAPAEQGSYKSNDSGPGILPMLNVVVPTTQPSEGSGDNVSFTVALRTPPGGAVDIALATDNVLLGTVSPSTLTFSNDNWDTPQTAYITGGGCDSDPTSNPSYLVTLTPSGTNYGAKQSGNFTMTNKTVPLFYVGSVTGFTSEAGENATLSVVLCTAPTADVTIPLKSSDTSQVTIQDNSTTTALTFSSGNWSTTQTFTLFGQDDIIVDDNRSITITLGKSTSFDGTYNGLAEQTRTVINVDNETPDFLIKSLAFDNTTLENTGEIGNNTKFNVALNLEPASDVIIPIVVPDATEATTSPSTLTFTTTNWMDNQTVTVTGADDFVADDNVSYSIVVGSPSAGPLGYTSLASKTLTNVNIDNDTAAVLIGLPSPINAGNGVTTEAGATATINVTLATQPTADVVIGVTSDDTTAGGTVSPATLTLTSANWNATTNTVTITGVATNANTNYRIIFAAATSTDAKYSGLTGSPDNRSMTNYNLY